MGGKIFVLTLLFALFLIPSALAHNERFGLYDGYERDRLVDFADRYPYDAYDRDVFYEFDDFDCFSLEDYNDFAGRSDYDRYEPITADNVDRSTLKKLSWTDYKTLADENSYDGINADDFRDYGDFSCSTLKEYNEFAGLDSHDKWDVVDFTDFDDLQTLDKLGGNRYGFFEPDDFDDFNLHIVRPRLRGWKYDPSLNYERYRSYYSHPDCYYNGYCDGYRSDEWQSTKGSNWAFSPNPKFASGYRRP